MIASGRIDGALERRAKPGAPTGQSGVGGEPALAAYAPNRPANRRLIGERRAGFA